MVLAVEGGIRYPMFRNCYCWRLSVTAGVFFIVVTVPGLPDVWTLAFKVVCERVFSFTSGDKDYWR